MKRRILFLAGSFALVIAIIYYFLSLSPLVTDNFLFSRDMRPGYARVYSGAPVEYLGPMTIAAAFRQASEMYFTWCGRFMGNLAVYLLFIPPRWLYNILAAIAFGLYVFLLQVCVFGRDWRENISAKWTLAVGGMLWLGIPSFGEAFLWLSVGGQIALLGQALIFLPFRFALDAPPRETIFNRLWRWPGLFILGAGVASLDYPTSAVMPATGAACVLWLWFKQNKGERKPPWGLVFATLGLALGAVLTLKAPGNAGRLLLTNDQTVLAYLAMSWPERIIEYMLKLPGGVLMQYIPLTLALWSALVLRRTGGRNWLKLWPIPSLLFFLPAALTYAAYLFTAWPPPRAFATPSAQLIVGALIVYKAAAPRARERARKYFRFLRASFCVFCAATLLYQGGTFYWLDGLMAEREKAILEAKGGEAVIPIIPQREHRYWPLWCSTDASPDPDFWVNRYMAAYYGVKKIAVAKDAPKSYRARDADPAIGEPDIKFYNRRFHVNLNRLKTDADYLRIYYYGDRAILNLLPGWLGLPVANWLGAADANDWRALLVPLLFARTDIELKRDADSSKTGISLPLKAEDTDNIWLVRPEDGKFSFNLERLTPVDKNNGNLRGDAEPPH